MTERGGVAAVVPELLPPGVYPIWSPYDAYEAADALMKALTADCMEQGQWNRTSDFNHSSAYPHARPTTA